MDKKVNIIKTADGKNIAVINNLRFRGRRSVDWNIVEGCLKEYIGEYSEVTETSDVVYIGADFPDEFAHSKDTKELRGANMYAKDGKMYLYDILRTKKETSRPLEQ